jgi:hypothetical protein
MISTKLQKKYRKAVETKNFDSFPFAEAEEEGNLLEEKHNWTIFHDLALEENLQLINPKELTYDRIFSKITKFGDTVAHIAAKSHQIQYIPKNLLTTKNILHPKNKEEESVLSCVIATHNIEHLQKILTTECLIAQSGILGHPHIERLARNLQLHKIPKELLTFEVLTCVIHDDSKSPFIPLFFTVQHNKLYEGKKK